LRLLHPFFSPLLVPEKYSDGMCRTNISLVDQAICDHKQSNRILTPFFAPFSHFLYNLGNSQISSSLQNFASPEKEFHSVSLKFRNVSGMFTRLFAQAPFDLHISKLCRKKSISQFAIRYNSVS